MCSKHIRDKIVKNEQNIRALFTFHLFMTDRNISTQILRDVVRAKLKHNYPTTSFTDCKRFAAYLYSADFQHGNLHQLQVRKSGLTYYSARPTENLWQRKRHLAHCLVLFHWRCSFFIFGLFSCLTWSTRQKDCLKCWHSIFFCLLSKCLLVLPLNNIVRVQLTCCR